MHHLRSEYYFIQPLQTDRPSQPTTISLDVIQAQQALDDFLQTKPENWPYEYPQDSPWENVLWVIRLLFQKYFFKFPDSVINQWVLQYANELVHQGYLIVRHNLTRPGAGDYIACFKKKAKAVDKSLGHVMLAGRIPKDGKSGIRSGIHEAIFSFSLSERGRGAKLPGDHTIEKIREYLKRTGNIVSHDLTEFSHHDGDSTYEPTMRRLRGESWDRELAYEGKPNVMITGNIRTSRMERVLEDLATWQLHNPNVSNLRDEATRTLDEFIETANTLNVNTWSYLWKHGEAEHRQAMKAAWENARQIAHQRADEVYRRPPVWEERIGQDWYAIWHARSDARIIHRQRLGKVGYSKRQKMLQRIRRSLEIPPDQWHTMLRPKVGVCMYSGKHYYLAWNTGDGFRRQFVGTKGLLSRKELERRRVEKENELVAEGLENRPRGIPRLQSWPTWDEKVQQMVKNPLTPTLPVIFTDLEFKPGGFPADRQPPQSHRPILDWLQSQPSLARGVQVLYHDAVPEPTTLQLQQRFCGAYQNNVPYGIFGKYEVDYKTGRIMLHVYDTANCLDGRSLQEEVAHLLRDIGRIVYPDLEPKIRAWLTRAEPDIEPEEFMAETLATDLFGSNWQNEIHLPKSIFKKYLAIWEGRVLLPDDLIERIIDHYHPGHGDFPTAEETISSYR
ncbi:MAG: hypothetical protein WC975_00625 [Phycisphaerae bacterium]